MAIFEPSTDVRTALTFTRREPIGNGIEDCGLFDEYKVGVDQALFWVVVLCEIFCIGLIVRYMPTAYAVSLVAAGVLIDLLLAFGHHRYSCRRVLNTRMFVAPFEAEISGKPDLGKSYEQRISTRKFFGFLFGVGLVIATTAKIYAYYVVTRGKVDTILFAVIALYIFICTIHLFVTGYAMSYIRAHGIFGLWGIDRERKSFNHSPSTSGYQAMARPVQILGIAAINECKDGLLRVPASIGNSSGSANDKTVCQVGEHTINIVTKDNKDPFLMLNAKGLLWNSEVKQLMSVFRTVGAKQEIALAALYLQSHVLVTKD